RASPAAATSSAASSAWAAGTRRKGRRASWSGTLVSVIVGRRRRQDFTETVRLQGADEPGLFHGLDEPGGTVVADLEAALDARHRRPARFHDDLHGLVVERIGLAVGIAPGGRFPGDAGQRHGGAFG